MKGQVLAQHESDAAPWQTPGRHNSSCWLQPGRKHSRRSSTASANGDLRPGGGHGGVWDEEETDSAPAAPPATGLASSTSTSGWYKFWGSFVSRLWHSCSWTLTNINASVTTASFPNTLTISSRNLKVNSLRMLRMQQKQLSKEPFNLWYLWKRSK